MEKGNYRSKPKIHFSGVDIASPADKICLQTENFEVNLISLQFDLEGKMETCFLDYQEGKPFFTWPGLIDDACLLFDEAEYMKNFHRMVSSSIVEISYEEFQGRGFLFVTNNKILMKRSFHLNCLVGSIEYIQSTIQIPSPDRAHRSYHYQLKLITAREEFSEQLGNSN
ncbi:hypothetical protein MKW98_031332, partial [Papaver atlanticum]